MRCCHALLRLAVLLLCVPAIAAMKPLSKTLTEDLITFAKQFNGASWTKDCWPSAWKTGLDGCEFYGVFCSGDVNGTYVVVTDINLPAMNVSGDISSSRLLSQFSGAGFIFSGNNLSGALPNVCDLPHGSPAYNVDFSRNALTAYDGSGMAMVQNLNVSHNRIGSPIEPLLTHLLNDGFFLDSFDVSHNRFVGDARTLGVHHPWQHLSTAWLDLSDNCLAGNLTWLTRSWYEKQGFQHFNLSGNYWTDAPDWCAADLCRPEARSRSAKGCPPPPLPPPPPARPLSVPQQLTACVRWTHYYTGGGSETESQGVAVDVPGQRHTLRSGSCFGGLAQGTSTQVQLAKLKKQVEWPGDLPAPAGSCQVSAFDKNVSFFSDTREYVYQGVDSSRGRQAHHWVTYPGDPYRQRDVWQPLNTTGSWDMWVTLGDFSQPDNRFGQWVYRWTLGVENKTFQTC